MLCRWGSGPATARLAWSSVQFAVIVSADRHFEPGEAGELHLGAQPQQRSWRDGLYPPEIHRVAGEQVPRVTSSAAQPDAAGEPIEQPAYGPRGGEGIPSGLTADALDDTVPRARRGRH